MRIGRGYPLQGSIEMPNDPTVAPRNQWINFLPILTFALMVGVLAYAEEQHQYKLAIWQRALVGVHLVAFYWISIRMVLRKHLNKAIILLVIFPATAVITYVVLLFLRPRVPAVGASAGGAEIVV
jgi:hypothetical protein